MRCECFREPIVAAADAECVYSRPRLIRAAPDGLAQEEQRQPLRLDGEAVAELVFEQHARGPFDPHRVEEPGGRVEIERRSPGDRIERVERIGEGRDPVPEAIDLLLHAAREGGRRQTPALAEIDDAVQVCIRLDPQVLEPETEVLGVEAHRRVLRVDELTASLGVLARDESLANGVDASSGPVPGLEHGHAPACPLELMGTGQAREPGADDDDVDPLRRRGEGLAGPERQGRTGRAGDQLPAREPELAASDRQGRSSYAGSVRNSTKSRSSATRWKSSAAGP